MKIWLKLHDIYQVTLKDIKTECLILRTIIMPAAVDDVKS